MTNWTPETKSAWDQVANSETFLSLSAGNARLQVGRHYSIGRRRLYVDFLKVHGISPRIALISQASGLAATGLISLSFLIFDHRSLVVYTALTAPLLLVITAFDAGMNQDYLVSGFQKLWTTAKTALGVLCVLVLLLMTWGEFDPVLLFAGSTYGLSLVFFSGSLALTWRKQFYRLEAMARLTVGIVTVLATLISVLLPNDAVLVILLTQAIGMAVLGFAVIAFSNKHGSVEISQGSPLKGNQYLVFLSSALMRGLTLNIVSNGFFLISQMAGASSEQLIDVRLGTLVSIAVNAITPVAPQHFVRLSQARQRKYLQVLTTLALAFTSASLIINALPSFEFRMTVLSVTVGIGVGAMITRIHLYINSKSFTFTWLSIVVLSALVACSACYLAQSLGGGAIAVLSGGLGLALVFELQARFYIRRSNSRGLGLVSNEI